MERLTMRNSDGTYSQPTHTTFEKMFYKLAFLEDLMEKYHCNDIVDLENMLQENTELKKKLSDSYATHLNQLLDIKDKEIEELKKKLENATKVNCVKCPHYHITVREENNTTIKSYDCKLGGSILTSGCPLKELKGE